jgi:CheY-like chemotaxis protein
MREESPDSQDKMCIRLLVAEDDEYVLRCYHRTFSNSSTSSGNGMLDSLSAELFGPDTGQLPQPTFELVACSQGEEAVDRAIEAKECQQPFDVAILDIRMPPGINGVEAANRIRQFDPDVPIVFVSGYSDISKEELQRRVPPPSKLHYFSKPLSFGDLAKEITRIVYKTRSAVKPLR